MTKTSKNVLVWALFATNICFMVASFSVFLMRDEALVRSLGEEDGLFQNVRTVFFFLVSAIFFVLFFRRRTQQPLPVVGTRWNLFYLGLAVLFLFGGGEDISWGQRIFGWGTPEILNQYNLQKEISIHNLAIFDTTDRANLLNMDRLYIIFQMMFGIAIPVGWRASSRLRSTLARLSFPLMSLRLGLLFLVDYAVFKIVWALVSQNVHYSLNEIRQVPTAFLFLAFAVTELAGPSYSPSGEYNPPFRSG